MTDDANWCEKQNPWSERQPHAFMLFRNVAHIQHGIKKVLQGTKPHSVLDEVKTPCVTSMAIKSFPRLTDWERLPGVRPN